MSDINLYTKPLTSNLHKFSGFTELFFSGDPDLVTEYMAVRLKGDNDVYIVAPGLSDELTYLFDVGGIEFQGRVAEICPFRFYYVADWDSYDSIFSIRSGSVVGIKHDFCGLLGVDMNSYLDDRTVPANFRWNFNMEWTAEDFISSVAIPSSSSIGISYRDLVWHSYESVGRAISGYDHQVIRCLDH